MVMELVFLHIGLSMFTGVCSMWLQWDDDRNEECALRFKGSNDRGYQSNV